MLQLVPNDEIILEYLNFRDDDDDDDDNNKEEDQNGDAAQTNDDNSDNATKKQDLNATGKLGSFKYLRCLAAFYIRLAWDPVKVYTTLEPLLTDYRKIKRRLKDTFTLTHIDQFVDDLLTKDRMCATSLKKLPTRAHLEDLELLEPRESPLGDEIDELDEEGEVERGSVGSYDRSSRSRSRSYDSRSRSRSRSRSYDSRDRRSSSDRSRQRTRSPGERGGRGSERRSRTRSRSRGRAHSDDER
ncbi:PRP38 family-domain-containing protein [Phaeosphaeriaceae sp. PMI808]|nr:PRP38 family-domain-containing protein [Phaeosphaeriaceae sp. PMI808]